MHPLSSSTEGLPRTFHVMTKPIGPLCSMKCRYCFYLEKEKLFPPDEDFRMKDEVLETYIRKYIRSQSGPEIQFAWQGGEPSLMGLDFFRKVTALQRRYAGGRNVSNTFQTNGLHLDDEWCRFLAQESFLVGLSLDGPAHIHDRYRVDKGGQGTFDRVMETMQRLKKWRVEFNTLTCVTRQSPDEAAEIYRFLKEQGLRFMQFIPIVERVGDAEQDDASLATPPDLHSTDNPHAMMPWSVSSEGWGRFLCNLFDEWVREDVGRIYVNLFEVALSAWCGMEPGLCTFAKECGQAVAMEHDGTIYSCDHYVYPSHLLGNVMEQSLEEMIYSQKQVDFGKDKSKTLPAYCRACEFLFACNGECPKHRFLNTPDGEAGLNYLCAGYKTFFSHADPTLQKMASLIREGRPASEAMQSGSSGAEAKNEVGRNDPCPCGSGRKYKKCCQEKTNER